MSKHTPGPWVIEHSIHGFYGSYFVTRGQPDSRDDICNLMTGLDGEREVDEMNANAQLIAAAPDMLAALEAMVNNHKKLINQECLDHITSGPLFNAIQAVKKAKGLTE